MEYISDFFNMILGIPAHVTQSVIAVIVMVILLFVVKRIFRGRIKHLEDAHGVGNRLSRLLRIAHTAIRYTIIIVGVLTILAINGIDIAAIATAAGAASIVLGFALKDTLEDFAMGARIVTDGYFKVGDSVKIGNDEGVVIAMTPQSTKIRNFSDNSVSTISNRNLQCVTVLGDFGDINIGLPYELPVADAKQVLEKACARMLEHESITDAQFKGTVEFDDSAIVYKLRVFCDPQARPQTMRDARVILQTVLEAEGVSCPFPQLDVHAK